MSESSVMRRLKESTQKLHDAAEEHPFQRSLFKGSLPIASYVENLKQMLLVHRALEGHLRDLCAKDPRVSAVVEDYQYQEPYLLEDLAHFEIDPSVIEATPGTQHVIDTIEGAAKDRPIALLGFHYVLEGSNNGGRFIAMAVRKAYTIEPGAGDRYLDPYGDDLKERWSQFKEQMEKANFTEAEQQSLVGAASAMFEGISRIGDDLIASPAVA